MNPIDVAQHLPSCCWVQVGRQCPPHLARGPIWRTPPTCRCVARAVTANGGPRRFELPSLPRVSRLISSVESHVLQLPAFMLVSCSISNSLPSNTFIPTSFVAGASDAGGSHFRPSILPVKVLRQIYPEGSLPFKKRNELMAPNRCCSRRALFVHRSLLQC